MTPPVTPNPSGRVASLHLHPAEPGAALQTVETIEVVAGKGIAGNPRYFEKPTRRQVSLIEREQIAEHAASLGMESIRPGAVRANIETLGVNLIALIGREVQIGDAVLRLYVARTPCHKMDAICAGLRERMTNQKQGVLAQVIRSGRIHVGDAIQL